MKKKKAKQTTPKKQHPNPLPKYSAVFMRPETELE